MNQFRFVFLILPKTQQEYVIILLVFLRFFCVYYYHLRQFRLFNVCPYCIIIIIIIIITSVMCNFVRYDVLILLDMCSTVQCKYIGYGKCLSQSKFTSLCEWMRRIWCGKQTKWSLVFNVVWERIAHIIHSHKTNERINEGTTDHDPNDRLTVQRYIIFDVFHRKFDVWKNSWDDLCIQFTMAGQANNVKTTEWTKKGEHIENALKNVKGAKQTPYMHAYGQRKSTNFVIFIAASYVYRSLSHCLCYCVTVSLLLARACIRLTLWFYCWDVDTECVYWLAYPILLSHCCAWYLFDGLFFRFLGWTARERDWKRLKDWAERLSDISWCYCHKRR